jgi:hypothetical protein
VVDLDERAMKMGIEEVLEESRRRMGRVCGIGKIILFLYSDTVDGGVSDGWVLFSKSLAKIES